MIYDDICSVRNEGVVVRVAMRVELTKLVQPVRAIIATTHNSKNKVSDDA
jgi:hypothetical protein